MTYDVLQRFFTQGTYPSERRCTLCASVDAAVAAVAGGVAGCGMEIAGAAAVAPSVLN